VLLILSVSPGIAVWGLDGWRQRGWRWTATQPCLQLIPVWPRQSIKLTLALAYFGAGYAKLVSGGIGWADGYTLQGYLLQKYLKEGSSAGYWLAQSYWASMGLSILTLLFEFTFILVPFFDNRHPVTWMYVTAGLAFHATIHVTMKITQFLPFMGLTYFVFLDWPMVRGLFPVQGNQPETLHRDDSTQSAQAQSDRTGSQCQAGERSPSGGQLSPAAAFILGTLGLHVACIGLGIEAWPFTDYGVFRWRFHPSRAGVALVRGVDQSQRAAWLQPQDLGEGFHGYYDGTNFSRYYLSRTGRLTFSDNAPVVLKDFLDHLTGDARRRFTKLQFVFRSVVKDSAGRWVETDRVLFESAPAVETP
jgi:hypothetical protein